MVSGDKYITTLAIIREKKIKDNGNYNLNNMVNPKDAITTQTSA